MFVALLLMCMGCPGGGDYTIPLARGYFIARVRPNDFALIAPDHRTVVVRSLARYSTAGDVVIGKLQQPPDEKQMFFVLDTRTGRLEVTDEKRWLSILQARGISDQTLRRPSPLQAVLR